MLRFSKFLPGKLSTLEQSIVYSPPAASVAPINLFIALISLLGPANREVPVSAIAWQPPWQNVDPSTLILKAKNGYFKGKKNPNWLNY